MTLTNTTRLASASTSAEFSGGDVVCIDEQGVSIPMETPIPAEGDWTYSATATGRTGEVGVDFDGVSVDLDGGPGFIYTGPSPGHAVRVSIQDLDLTAGINPPTEGDDYTVAVLLNNDVIAVCDEGWLDGADLSNTEINIDTYVGGIQTSDVLRVAVLVEEGVVDEEADITVAESGSLVIV